MATGLVATLLGALPSAPAYAANPVTPGNFTGYGFDQCDAPSQSAMSTWIKKSPFRAAGIYISGNSRACRTQSNLTPTWVKNQLAAGWHLMPITLGPQASCSTRYPRYGKNIDPTIIPTAANTYYAARSQGRAEARKAVDTAQRLGIVRGQHAVLRPRGLQHPREHDLHELGAVVPHRLDPPAARPRLRVRLLLERRVGHQDDGRPPSRPEQPADHARPGLDRGLERQGQHQLVVHPQ